MPRKSRKCRRSRESPEKVGVFAIVESRDSNPVSNHRKKNNVKEEKAPMPLPTLKMT